MAQAPRIYLCASEWIALLRDEDGAQQVASLVDRAKRGAFEIVGSELLRLEVLGPGSDALLSDGIHTWAALDRRVAVQARTIREELIAEGANVQRLTADIIHIATAMVADVECFSASDKTCRGIGERFGLPAYERGGYPEGELDI